MDGGGYVPTVGGHEALYRHLNEGCMSVYIYFQSRCILKINASNFTVKKKKFSLCPNPPKLESSQFPKPCCHTVPLDLTGCQEDFPRTPSFAF